MPFPNNACMCHAGFRIIDNKVIFCSKLPLKSLALRAAASVGARKFYEPARTLLVPPNPSGGRGCGYIAVKHRRRGQFVLFMRIWCLASEHRHGRKYTEAKGSSSEGLTGGANRGRSTVYRQALFLLAKHDGGLTGDGVLFTGRRCSFLAKHDGVLPGGMAQSVGGLTSIVPSFSLPEKRNGRAPSSEGATRLRGRRMGADGKGRVPTELRKLSRIRASNLKSENSDFVSPEARKDYQRQPAADIFCAGKCPARDTSSSSIQSLPGSRFSGRG